MNKLLKMKNSQWMILGLVLVVACSMSSFLYLNHQETIMASVQADHLIVKSWENENGVITWLANALKSFIGIV